ncbi:uncharacterized protein JCM6883_004035 [Sporobolomyces salmoneus]|uniref:uncharacterized protein n=1 Tax=Sporobolomyces salmoneus TaxID=183962 RepID=UPI003176D305
MNLEFAPEAGPSSLHGQKRASISRDSGTKGKPQKTRQRVSLSCKECRRLKLKCDRSFPCSSCKRRGCADICPDGVRKPPGRALEIQAEFSLLAKRVEFLENLVTELGAGDRIPPALKLQHASKKTSSFLKELESQIEHASNTRANDDDIGGSDEDLTRGDDFDAENGDASENETEAKLVVGVGSLSIGADEGTRYLGASAAPSYFFSDDEDDDDEQGADETQDDGEGHPVVQLGAGQRGIEEVETYRKMLPPFETAKSLADNYFNFLAFQFLPLSPQQFYEDYLPSSYTPNDPSPTKLGCLYAVLSLGSLFDPEKPSTFSEQAQRYFLRSQNVLAAAKALSHNTLATSQTLQLCGSFLLCQHNLREGRETFFPMLGIASRLIVTQALHRDGTLFGIQGDELNRRRRVFWEFSTIERMQAYISGRPYILQDSQFDTKFPDDASTFDIAKWQLGTLIGKIINKAFSLEAPSYSTILKLDAELRSLVRSSPDSLRSGALPANAFVEKLQFVPQLPATAPPSDATLIEKLQHHTMDQMYSQVLFYLHKPGYAMALLHHPNEPLQSPYRASVEALALETAVYLVAVAKSWITLHPVLCPRWWHIYFHAFAAAVSQASLVIKSPTSLLAPHSWTQLKEAVTVFEIAGSTGAPCSMYIPRLKTLQEKAFISLQNLLSVPLGLGSQGSSDQLLEGEIARSILNPPARLERKAAKGKSSSSGAPSPPGSGPGNSPSPRATTSAMPQDIPYSPFDARIYPSVASSSSLPNPPHPALPPQHDQYNRFATPSFSSILPESHNDAQTNSLHLMPTYPSALSSFPTEQQLPPLDAYALPLESQEFGGFATSFPASHEWIQPNQSFDQQGEFDTSGFRGQQSNIPTQEPSPFPSYFDFANYAA